MNKPCFIHGIHGSGGEFLMDKHPGWIVFTHGIGDDPNDHTGFDYRQWSDRGFGIIARLNYGYGSAGTIPSEGRYNRFAVRCSRFVNNSKGCWIWVIGNEPNHAQERPDGVAITPRMYADCFSAVWRRIKWFSTREHHEVVPAPIAPWNVQTPYLGNEHGDWIQYFIDVLDLIAARGVFPDALALHTYTHGHDPALIVDESTMNLPFQGRRYNFRTYIDFMEAIPQDMHHLPVYITEIDANDSWSDINNGWVQKAYEEVNWWNVSEEQSIFALILYRWQYDRWQFKDKHILHEDIECAFAQKYTWCAKRRQLGVRCCVSV